MVYKPNQIFLLVPQKKMVGRFTVWIARRGRRTPTAACRYVRTYLAGYGPNQEGKNIQVYEAMKEDDKNWDSDGRSSSGAIHTRTCTAKEFFRLKRLNLKKTSEVRFRLQSECHLVNQTRASSQSISSSFSEVICQK